MPRLWNATIDAHRATVREAIFDAAMSLVAERGLRGVTMAAIAERVGIGRATLYRYFPDAEAVLRGWHERQINRHLAELAAARDAVGDAGERLAAVLETYALIAHGARGGHDAEFAAFLHGDENVRRAEHHAHGLLAELLARAAAEGVVRTDVAPNELASYSLHALNAAGRLASRASVRRLVAVTLAGLRPDHGDAH